MLTNSISKAVFKGNGVATQFPFIFRVWEKAQLQVLITAPDGVTTETTQFSVDLTENGGTVMYTLDGSPLAEGYTLVILRQMPFVQEVDLINGTRFDPSVIEDALDKATAERQELRERAERSIVMPPSSEVSPDQFAETLFNAAVNSEKSANLAAQSAESSASSAQNAENSANLASSSASSAAQSAEEAQVSAAKSEQSVKYLGYVHGGTPASEAVVTLSGGTPSSFV